MSSVFEGTRQDLSLMELLTATGEEAPSLEEKCHLAQALRAESPRAARQLDRMLLGKIGQLGEGLHEAESNLHELKQMVDKLIAPPWTTAVFLRLVDTPEGQRAMVFHGSTRRVINAAEDFDLDSLEIGDEVFVNSEASAVIGKSFDGPPRVGETARFDRYTDDRRLVLQWRDEEIVVEAAGPLQRVELASGDEVRWDRATWLAYEPIERAAGREYLLGEVPDARPEQIGGQRRALDTLLNLLKARFVDPRAAAMYGLNGKQSALMVGPPGCGKTLLARIVGSELSRATGKQCRFAVVKPAEWWDPLVGVTEQNIRNCFHALSEAAQETGLAILFLDEIDSVGRLRGSAVGHHGDRFLGALLAEIDGFKDRGDVAIMAATNRKDLCDPGLLERFKVEISIGRPDMQGAREIFQVHFPESMPVSPNGELAASTRSEIIDRGVSRLYSPNGENELCVIRFHDGTERTVTARELISGRSIEQICEAAGERGFSRYLCTGEHGVRAEDMDEAVSKAIQRWSTALAPENAHAYLSDLRQDFKVVAVTPVMRRVDPGQRYLNTH